MKERERERKKKRKLFPLMCLDFGYRKERKEKKCESFIFPLFVCKDK